MLLLVAFGIASADIIKINTDLIFNEDDITLEGYNIALNYPVYMRVTVNYNSALKELTVSNYWMYRITINGFTLIDHFPAQIYKSGINMRYNDYYVIEKYFDRVPGDPGTPITQ